MEGLWTLEFGSNAGIFGSGVIVIRSGKIEGGDASYYYVGSYEQFASDRRFPSPFKAQIEVKPFLPGAESIFKTYNRDLILELEGTFTDENNGVAVGKPKGMPDMNVGIRLTRRSEVV